MPFDFPAEPKTLVPEKSLANLAFVLRNRELWPKGFVWNYADCSSCAMGLAEKLWSLKNFNDTWNILADHNLMLIFLGLGGVLFKPHKDVTPEDVADALDLYLKRP